MAYNPEMARLAVSGNKQTAVSGSYAVVYLPVLSRDTNQT